MVRKTVLPILLLTVGLFPLNVTSTFCADAKTLFIQGTHLLKEGSLNQAIQVLSHAIEELPTLADAYVNRGLAYYEKGQIERAKEDFSVAITLDYDNETAHNNLGLIYFEYGDHQKAIYHLETALKLSRDGKVNQAIISQNLAYLYGLLGKSDYTMEARQNPIPMLETGNSPRASSVRSFGQSRNGYYKILILKKDHERGW